MGESMQPGTFAKGDVESIVVRSREFLGPINGSASFTLQSLLMNPGSVQAFPQLSKLAMHYDQYKFNGLIFWYHSTSGESTNSADTAIGEVMLASQADSTEPVPANKIQMMRLDGTCAGKPSLDAVYGVECDAGLSPIKYIRHGEPSENSQDAARYDLGKFHIAVEGCNAAVTRIGELWVTYDITLIRSRDSKGEETAAYCMSLTNALSTNLFSNSTSVYSLKWNSLPITLANNTITFPPFVCDGDYEIKLLLPGVWTSGTTFYQSAPWATTFNNCSFITGLRTRALNVVGEAGSGADTTCMYYSIIRVNAPGSTVASMTFDNSALWPATTSTLTGSITVIVTRCPYQLTGI